ncbi:MAG TPA: hypothetical protein DCR62_00905 [Acholeplasmatales bacterium]|jgi:DNA-binding MarR family transcriptional regulator|nr:transcriptional regulator [Staphylococcus sp. CAG:324]HAR57300.1 hypothetical protein [Acholeplasmatales bacterium]
MLHQLFIQLYINNKLFIDLIENICKKHNINHLQLYIIILSSYEKMNVSTLSDTLNITKSAISQAIVGLSIRRLIVKVQSKEDKKVFYITPTNKAEKMKREIVSLCEDKYQIFEEKMGKEDMMMFIDLIVKFNNILEELKNYKEGKKC